MHGTLNRSIQCFVTDQYGQTDWHAISAAAAVPDGNFEALLDYSDDVTEAVLTAATAHFGKSRDDFLEDLGTYLVSHPTMQAVRRLLRFGGVSFADFVRSLDELPDRVRLAVPYLEFPFLRVSSDGAGTFHVHYRFSRTGYSAIALGVMRAMADDYGALAFVNRDADEEGGKSSFTVQVFDHAFAAGREFQLAQVPT